MRSPSEPVSEKNIHRNPEKSQSGQAVDGEVQVTGLAIGGTEVDPNSLECLAKKSFDPSTRATRFWLKRGTMGPEAGRLFNPQNPLFEAGNVTRYNSALGKGQYEFRKANEDEYNLYVEFLKTGNPAYARQAERSSM